MVPAAIERDVGRAERTQLRRLEHRPRPYGYLPERHTHPNPMKAAAGRTKTHLAPDPDRGPVIAQIYRWRVTDQLGVPTIRTRLNADPATYPPRPRRAGP